MGTVGTVRGTGTEEASPAILAGSAVRPAQQRAVSEGQWSLRVTVGRAFREDLETLSALLSHKIPRGDLGVLHEAIRCAIEKHGKRKGAVRPSRKVAPKGLPKAPATVTAELRRQVWKRDEVHAEEVYGRRHMQKYRRVASTIAGGSPTGVPLAREAHAAG